jgi:hypothetical protein
MVSKTVEIGNGTQPSGEPLVLVATYLPLRSYTTIPSFIRLSGRIEAQLRASKGAVRYSLKTDIPGKRFWTVSVWTGWDEMALFSRSEPHRSAMAKFFGWGTADACIAQWESEDGKVDWAEAEDRLKKPLFRYRLDGKRLVHAPGSRSVEQS